MIILDAYAVLALLKGEAAAEEVESLLRATEPAALTAAGVAEVIDHLVRIVGADEDVAVLDLAQLDLLDPLALDEVTATSAGLLRARHYHRSRCAVSMADCFAAEVARNRDAELATADPHLLDVCHGEGIATQILTASDGTRWSPSS